MRFRTGATDAICSARSRSALLAGAWMVGKLTVNHLLAHDAAMTGQGWAAYLAENLKDLDRSPQENSRPKTAADFSTG